MKLRAILDFARLSGVEIGALDFPIVDKREGRILYVDHVDTAALKAKYAPDPTVDISKIVEVDAVWGERTLAQAIQPHGPVDYIVASHVIEHVPDLLTWLKEAADILTPQGKLHLAVPDRRFTFDYLRRETTLADMLAASVAKVRRPGPAPIIDYHLNIAYVDNVAAWRGQLDPATLKKRFSFEKAMTMARESLAGQYHDVHCWIFTPASFIDLFHQASRFGLMPFACERLFDTDTYHIEFIVSLVRNEDPAQVEASWAAAAAHYAAVDVPNHEAVRASLAAAS